MNHGGNVTPCEQFNLRLSDAHGGNVGRKLLRIRAYVGIEMQCKPSSRLHSTWPHTWIFILVNCKLVKFKSTFYLFNFWTHDITKILVASILICLMHMVSHNNNYIKLYMIM